MTGVWRALANASNQNRCPSVDPKSHSHNEVSVITPDHIARNPSEEAQQTAYFCWISWQVEHTPDLKWAFAIPNGGLRDKITAGKLKAQGVKAGVPDVFIPVPKMFNGVRYAGLWLELKKVNGVVSDAQRDWQAYLSNAGYAHRICVGYVAMRDATKLYMGLDRAWKDVD